MQISRQRSREEHITSTQQLLPAPTGVAVGRGNECDPHGELGDLLALPGQVDLLFRQENTKHLLPVCLQPSPCPPASVLSPDSSSEHIHPTEC